MKMEFPGFDRAPIDIHTHFNHGAEGEYDTPAYAGTHRNGLDFLKGEYARFGIGAYAASTYAAVMSDRGIPEENILFKNAMRLFPRAFGE